MALTVFVESYMMIFINDQVKTGLPSVTWSSVFHSELTRPLAVPSYLLQDSSVAI
jgi:hypothetical protein